MFTIPLVSWQQPSRYKHKNSFHFTLKHFFSKGPDHHGAQITDTYNSMKETDPHTFESLIRYFKGGILFMGQSF